jgi:hypothetical protein
MSATQAAGAAVNSRSARRLGASHQRLHCERGDTRVVAGGASPRPRRFGASFSAREEPFPSRDARAMRRSARACDSTVQCRTRRVSHPHVAMSFLPAIQKTRRPASRNRSTSCGRVRICLSRAMTTRLRVATAGIQSGSRTPSGHSGISLWPACTVSRRAASRPCPVRGRFHQRRSGGDRGRRSRPAPSSGGSRFGGRAVGTTELVAKRLQDGFAS